MRKREFEKLLKQAIIEEAEEQGAIFEASPETEPIPETAQARFDAALNGKRKSNRSVFTRLRYFAYRNSRRLAFGAIAAGTVAALVLVVGLLTRTVLNGKKGGSAPEKGDDNPTNAPVQTSEPGPLETNAPEGTTEPSSVDALVGTWMLEAVENEDESQSGQIAVINAMIAAGKYEATYTFLSDGNGLAYWDIEGEKTAQAFTYVVDGDKLTFSGETMTFEIDGDRMKLRETDLTMLFKRKEKGAAEETNEPEGTPSPGWTYDAYTGTLYIDREDAIERWDKRASTDVRNDVRKIVFAEGVLSIPHSSFEDLKNLKEVVLPDSLESIDPWAFYGCSKLEQIIIPKNVSYIGNCVFDSVKSVTVDPENAFFVEENGIVYTSDYTTVKFASKDVTNVVIPEGVTTIDDGAFFRCEGLKTIDLPDSLQTIGLYAFMECTSLESVQLPASLKELWDHAFAECVSLREMRIPKDTQLIFIGEDYYFTGSGVKRLILEGNLIDFTRYLKYEDGITQMVCLGEPPADPNPDFRSFIEPSYTVYYLNKNKKAWAPNGETEWNGIPIVGIDSLDDLPPVWSDNGIDGIGVVRGNSNGNLYRNYGRALCDGNDIYYVDQKSDPVRICRYNLSTKETQVLVELKDESSRDIVFLNLIGTDLYYVDKSFEGDTNSIYRLSTEDLSVQKIGDHRLSLFFLAAYERLFIADREGTTICDLDGTEIKRIDGFIICGAMDGVLYGEDKELNCCVSLDLNGNVVDRYESVRNPIPINGYLVELNYFEVNEKHIDEITIINVSSKESRVFEVTQIGCSNYYNVSRDWIYLQEYGLDEMGEIYRIDWSGNGFTKVDDRVFKAGISLWEDTILADYVPCDREYKGSLEW